MNSVENAYCCLLNRGCIQESAEVDGAFGWYTCCNGPIWVAEYADINDVQEWKVNTTKSEDGFEFSLSDVAREKPNALRTRPNNEFKDLAAQVALQGAPEVDGKRGGFP